MSGEWSCPAICHAAAQLFQRSGSNQTPVLNDADVRTKALDDFQDVRGEENGAAVGDEALQEALERGGGNGIHAFKRLVEKKYFRAVNDGGGKRGLLLHAVRVVGDQLFAPSLSGP